MLPPRLQAAQSRRGGHARRPAHVPAGPPRTLLVDEMDDRLEGVLPLGHPRVRRQLVAQSLDFELLGWVRLGQVGSGWVLGVQGM